MYPTGVGSGDTTLLIAAHTAGDTSQSTPRNLPVASAVSSAASGFQLTAGGDSTQREAQSEVRRAGEVFCVLSAKERDLAQNNFNKSQTTQRLPPAKGELPSVARAVGGRCAK